MGIIYLITNIVNNKSYIGQTIRSFKKRWYEHCKENKCSVLSMAIQKYSSEKFTYKILINCDNDELNDYEKQYIKEYNTLVPNGYNIQSGGALGRIHCDESREKMRQSKLGDKNHNFGKPRTNECKKNISISKSGNNHHFYGKNLTIEHKKKLSLSHKTDDLPMYFIHLKKRPSAYQSEGYAIINHPTLKNKYFTSKVLTMEEKFNLAMSYLNSL